MTPNIPILSILIYFEKKIPLFKNHIIEDIYLYQLLFLFFQTAFKNSDKMLIETYLINALSYLIKNYTSKTKEVKELFDNKLIIKNSIEYIKDSLDTNISLDDLYV